MSTSNALSNETVDTNSTLVPVPTLEDRVSALEVKTDLILAYLQNAFGGSLETFTAKYMVEHV